MKQLKLEKAKERRRLFLEARGVKSEELKAQKIGTLPYWEQRLLEEEQNAQIGTAWYDKTPFSETEDPLYGISASDRWKLVEPLLHEANNPTPTSIPPEPEAPLDQIEGTPAWRELKHWLRKMDRIDPSLAKAQRSIVSAYSGPAIALRRAIYVPSGPTLPRAARGNLVDSAGLALLPEKFAAALRSRLNEITSLAHIQGILVTLPNDSFKTVKT